jgi:uncharacterized protein YjbI with pentapeptide repeats
MANKEHISILGNGVEVWNTWRKSHPLIIPDLRGANLSEMNLNGINLRHANLRPITIKGRKLAKFLDNRWRQRATVYGTFKYGYCGVEGDVTFDLSDPTVKDLLLPKALKRLENAALERFREPSDFDHPFPDKRGGLEASCESLEWEVQPGDLKPSAELRVASNLRSAHLEHANLELADLRGVILCGAKLMGARLIDADLRGANLERADITGAKLSRSILSRANLRHAILRRAELYACRLVGADLSFADLTDSIVYGTSAWNLKLDGAIQNDLVITPAGSPKVTVDNIELAQFVSLLLKSSRIRDVINTMTSKAVLILGRFTPSRKEILDAVRERLKELGYVPIIFDFDRVAQRDFTETIMILCGMCLFVIADISDPSAVPVELATTVPNYMVPFVPILEHGMPPYSMFVNLQTKYHWVLDVVLYENKDVLVGALERVIVQPAMRKQEQLLAEKAKAPRTRDVTIHPKPASSRPQELEA